jgi:hypothetical protein
MGVVSLGEEIPEETVAATRVLGKTVGMEVFQPKVRFLTSSTEKLHPKILLITDVVLYLFIQKMV